MIATGAICDAKRARVEVVVFGLYSLMPPVKKRIRTVEDRIGDNRSRQITTSPLRHRSQHTVLLSQAQNALGYVEGVNKPPPAHSPHDWVQGFACNLLSLYNRWRQLKKKKENTYQIMQ